MYKFKQILKTDLLNLIKNPIWLFLSVGFPLLLVLVMGFLGDSSQGTLSSYGYFGVTFMLFSALNASSFAANAFMEERIKAPNMRIITSPIPAFFIPLSKIIATFIYTVALYTLDGLLLHFIFKINYGGQLGIYVWLILVTVDFFAITLAILFCVLLKSESITNQILSLVIQLLSLLSGCFFPIYVLGETMGKISSFSPLSKVVKTLFEIIYDHSLQQFAPTILIMLIMSGICLLGSLGLFKGEDYV